MSSMVDVHVLNGKGAPVGLDAVTRMPSLVRFVPATGTRVRQIRTSCRYKPQTSLFVVNWKTAFV